MGVVPVPGLLTHVQVNVQVRSILGFMGWSSIKTSQARRGTVRSGLRSADRGRGNLSDEWPLVLDEKLWADGGN